MSSTILFTGHMVDRPGRVLPRFPTSLQNKIALRIASELEAACATDGFASAACGGDILFFEAMLARGGRIHITLPCSVEAFRKDCADIVPGADWGVRFDRILNAAHTAEILGEQYASDNAVASECCNRIMVGLAERCAQDKGEEPLVIALWDGKPGDAALGGTHSTVQFCLQNGFTVRWMTDLSSDTIAETRELRPLATAASSAIRHDNWVNEAPQQICAVIFADAVGYRKLREREIPRFVRYYLSTAMQTLQTHSIAPLVKNTWGDALYLVFETVREAGLFAVEFRDRIVSTDWSQLGFGCTLSVRIGAHAGPLYRIYDPIFGQWSYVGSHVTRTARLEPSTDTGKVFASLPFVALAAAERVTEFTCHPVGRRQLVKDAGEMTVFELARVKAET
jgi:class 3 adenylate cyclase